MLTIQAVTALQDLATAADDAARAREALQDRIAAARAAGASWASIAQMLGCSKQAAAQRYTPRTIRRDTQALMF